MGLIDFSALSPEERKALFNGPALEPPAGVIPNLENPPNDNVTGYAILTFLTAIVALSVGNRLYAGFLLGRASLADYLTMIAFGLYVGLITLVYMLIAETGIFVHQWNIRLGDTPNFLKYTFHTATIFSTLMGVIKAAILIDWIRIFVPTGTRNFMFWGCHFFLWVNTAFTVAMIVTNNIACVPYEYSWNKLINGNCDLVDTAMTNLCASIFNFLMDIFVFFLPQWVIWKLHLSTKKKFAVSLVFMVGIAAIVATGIRLGITVANVNSEDYTYTFSAVMLCALGEATCGFLVLCGPTFPKVASTVAQSKLISSVRSWSLLSSKRTRATNDTVDTAARRITPKSNYYARIEEGGMPIHMQPISKRNSNRSDWGSEENLNQHPTRV